MRFVTCAKAGFLYCWESAECCKKALFEQFIYKNDQFAKTGSGQTQEKLRKKGVVCRTARRTEQYSFAEGWMVQPKPAWIDL